MGGQTNTQTQGATSTIPEAVDEQEVLRIKQRYLKLQESAEEASKLTGTAEKALNQQATRVADIKIGEDLLNRAEQAKERKLGVRRISAQEYE